MRQRKRCSARRPDAAKGQPGHLASLGLVMLMVTEKGSGSYFKQHEPREEAPSRCGDLYRPRQLV
jgi:hypothetical protein